MFRKFRTKEAGGDIQSRVSDSNISISSLIIREYNRNEFNESIWRLKWEDFVHPDTGESGQEYLKRMKDIIPLNPELQKDSPKLILVEPLYGPVK